MKDLELAKKIVPALGGQENIVRAHNCLTRLRTTVKEPLFVKINELENIDGVKGVVVEGSDVHVVLGAGTAKKVTDEVIRIFDVPRKS
ncbi:MAG: PTS transporter subunit EIIB [Tissierellia bacterium]|nr:PTS transporter subunit EIIB [Tissierellia bacterium]